MFAEPQRVSRSRYVGARFLGSKAGIWFTPGLILHQTTITYLCALYRRLNRGLNLQKLLKRLPYLTKVHSKCISIGQNIQNVRHFRLLSTYAYLDAIIHAMWSGQHSSCPIEMNLYCMVSRFQRYAALRIPDCLQKTLNLNVYEIDSKADQPPCTLISVLRDALSFTLYGPVESLSYSSSSWSFVSIV